MDAHVAKPINRPALFAVIDRLTADRGPSRPLRIAAPAIDEDLLDSLGAQIGADQVLPLIELFEQAVQERLAILDAPVPPSTLLETAHAMASMSGSLGFVELARHCRRAMENPSSQDAAAVIADLRGAALRALDAARQFRQLHALEKPLMQVSVG